MGGWDGNRGFRDCKEEDWGIYHREKEGIFGIILNMYKIGPKNKIYFSTILTMTKKKTYKELISIIQFLFKI